MLEEANKIQIPAMELARRPLVIGISIDSPNPAEIDDACSVRRTPAGGYELTVSIADPTALFLCDGATDMEARKRGRSFYRVDDTCLPMLPEPLVKLASLTPGNPKLALTVVMTFDEKGKRLETEVCETVFINHRAMDFSEAGRIAQKGCPDDPLVDETLRCGGTLARLLKSRRKDLLPEGYAPWDNGEPHKIAKPVSGEEALGSLMVQEFMLVTNTAIAEFMDGKMPLLFRCHGVKAGMPARDVMRAELQRLFGCKGFKNIEKTLGVWVDRACYSTNNDGHIGLGLERYAHATSPLRRYADMVVHRFLRILLRGGEIPKEEQMGVTQHLESIAKAISVTPSEKEGIEEGFPAVLSPETLKSMRRKEFGKLLNFAVKYETSALPILLEAAKIRKLAPIHLARIMQKCFRNKIIADFLHAYFAQYNETYEYIETLRQLCQLNGWDEPTCIEKKENIAKRGELPIDGWAFKVFINGKSRRAKVEIFPNATKEQAKNKAAFFFLWDYIRGQFGNIAKDCA
ncbi:MAG: RNB domain-containing ribonuclease [Candidatus Margulisiibacteriota bacterium]